MKIKNYEELLVWQKAHSLVISIYTLTQSFPANEVYGLTSQIRRAAISIPANIAEGYGRNHLKEYIQFLHISAGSLNEMRYYLRLSLDLRYLSLENYSRLNDLASETSKMLTSLIKSLKNKKTGEDA